MAKNIRGINKMIDEKFPGYYLVQGEGYVYIWGNDAHEWYSTSFCVCRVSQLSPERWMDEVEEAIKNKTTQKP